MSPPPFDISDLLNTSGGFMYPPWEEVGRRVRTRPADVQPAAWADATRQWLGTIREWIGERYAVFESEHFQMLAWAGEEFGEQLLRHAEYCRRSLRDLFPEIARFAEPGKHVVLAFPDPRVYYTYLSGFYPDEGEFGGSVGMHIRAGYPHIVTCGVTLFNVQAIVAHELTHAALHHLGSPQWVEEGIAQLVEQAAMGRPPLEVTPEIARNHKRYWGRYGLEAFWWGGGFHLPGRPQQLSYELAEILMRLLIDEHRPGWFGIGRGKRDRLIGFLKVARQDDAGQDAAITHLRYSLGVLAAKYLGPGDWEPKEGPPSSEAAVNDVDENAGS